jgi:glutathionylspermidine synthase
MTHSLKHYEVQNIKIENDSGQQRVFSINDGFQERVLRKVVHWLNNSSRVNGTNEVSLGNPSNKLTLKMANDEVITIEPAYTCVVVNKRKTCTAKDGELIVRKIVKKHD